MSGFSTEWLALRETADTAARANSVLESCRRHFAGRSSVIVCDLGAGTGSSVRAFERYLPSEQHWLLVDSDLSNLEAAERWLAGTRPSLRTKRTDLSTDSAPWPPGCDLVTASALFDLASPQWIARFCEKLAADRLPLLATLTYDGSQALDPPHRLDAAMLRAFNAHQRTDKGLGGAAAGPMGAQVLERELHQHRFRVERDASPWMLTAENNRELIAATLQGWADAIIASGLIEFALATEWLAARLAHTERMVVSQTDLFAAPP
jgi:hypothetical protein